MCFKESTLGSHLLFTSTSTLLYLASICLFIFGISCLHYAFKCLACTYVCILQTSLVLTETQRVYSKALGTGLTGSCKSPGGCWKVNPGTL